MHVKNNHVVIRGDYAEVDISTKKHPGIITVIDIDDLKYINDGLGRWKIQSSYALYATRQMRSARPLKTQRLHRLIIDAKDGEVVDHIDFNGLNNRKYNLRVVSIQQNGMHCRKHHKYAGSETASKYKGVFWHKNINRWCAAIHKDRVRIWIGSFLNEIDAALAYNAEAIKLHGEYAVLNEVTLP